MQPGLRHRHHHSRDEDECAIILGRHQVAIVLRQSAKTDTPPRIHLKHYYRFVIHGTTIPLPPDGGNRSGGVPLTGCLPGRAEHRSYRSPAVTFGACHAHRAGQVALASGDPGERRGDVPQCACIPDVPGLGFVLPEPARQLVSVTHYYRIVIHGTTIPRPPGGATQLQVLPPSVLPRQTVKLKLACGGADGAPLAQMCAVYAPGARPVITVDSPGTAICRTSLVPRYSATV